MSELRSDNIYYTVLPKACQENGVGCAKDTNIFCADISGEIL